jgi:hypothetical protein
MAEDNEKALINYTKEAFRLPVNIAFLGIMTAAAVALEFIPQLVGFNGIGGETMLYLTAGLESLYLALMPSFSPFVRLVNSRKGKEIQRVETQIQTLQYISALGTPLLEKYTIFLNKKNQINANLMRQKGSEGVFTEEFRQRFETLENHYVELMHQANVYEKFLAQAGKENKGDWDKEIADLEQKVAESTGRVKEMHQKRLNLVQKREGRSEQVKENLEIVRIQIATLDDTINYLMEQSLSLHNVDEFNRMVDSIIQESEDRTQTVEEIQNLLSLDSLDGEMNSSSQRVSLS